MLALTVVKSYLFSKFVPIVASEAVYFTNSVIGCQKKPFRILLLPLVLSANNDYRVGCFIFGTFSRITYLLTPVVL